MAEFSKVVNTQMTAPTSGRGLSVRPDKGGAVAGEAEFDVASIDTNVVIGVQYSDDHFETVKHAEVVTVTANGKTVMPIRVGVGRFVRPVFSTESGGTAATVNVTTRLYN